MPDKIEMTDEEKRAGFAAMIAADLVHYMKDKLKEILKEQGHRPDIIEACMSENITRVKKDV
jgi:glycyl-tRNA synthetase beta subunit